MKKPVLSLRVLLVACAWLLLLQQPVHAQLQLTWTKPAALNAGLPPSVQVFYSNSSVAPGIPLKMYYALVDLNDPNMEFKAVYGGGGAGTAKTPNAWAALEKDPVYAVINGGFFNTTTYQALGTTVQNGNVLSINPKNDGAFYPTRSAFGVLPGNIADIAWIYHVGAENTMYHYPNPNPVSGHTQQPSATYPAGAQLWPATTAIGCGPVLVHNGQVRVTADDERQWASWETREPRSAIGRTADNKVILMVVEGRNPSISEGITLPHLAEVFKSIGAVEAMNLDGGGSSAMPVLGKNTILPSDAGGVQRAVPTALILKRRTHGYDTENAAVYAERGGAWTESNNDGFYGPSKSRVLAVGDGTKYASYKFEGINPGRYELSAWWVGSGNRASDTPYIIYRNGAAKADTVRVNQTQNTGKFNVIGTFDLGPKDSLVVSNAATTGEFVTIDAINLVKVGESMPAIAFANNLETAETIFNQNAGFDVKLTSPNTGFTVQKLRVFKKINDAPEAQVGADVALGGVYSFTHPFVYDAADAVGSNVRFRFELEDSFGRTVSKNFTYRVVTPTQVVFKNGALEGSHPQLRPFSLPLTLETRQPSVNLKELKVFKSLDGGAEEQVGSTIELAAQPSVDYTFTHTLTSPVNSKVDFRFEVRDVNNVKASRTYRATVTPPRGDFRMAVISDLNSSFGSVTYEWQVDSIMQRIPRLWAPDMVVAGGDMVAGQSATLTATQVEAMWNGFDQNVARPLKNAGIPFAFTMGNHDAAPGMTIDRAEAEKYWKKAENMPSWHPVDMTNYPFYFSYKPNADSEIFFVSWEASNANISAAQLAWVREQFSSPVAKAAKFRFLIGHIPLYGVAQEYNTAGNILNNAAALQAMMEELDVHTYISGHHHAYYPGKHGGVEFLNAGAAGTGPRRYMGFDELAPNTVTLMDVFLEQDTIIYTTYEIKEENAANMRVFDDKRLPEIMHGLNGYVIRRDVVVSGAGAGALSAYNMPKSRISAATGTVQATDMGGTVEITGTFSGLQGTILPDKGAVALYQGSYPTDGVMKLPLKVLSANGETGTFSGTLPADAGVKELISTGAYYVLIKTDAFPAGELRTQLYKTSNQAPVAPVISSHNTTDTYPVRNIKAVFPVMWGAAKDPEANAVTYTYQVAKDEQFTQMVLDKAIGVSPTYTVPQDEWFALLGTAAAGEAVTFYHRVLASDGKNVTYGMPAMLKLEKNADPVTGPVTIPAPGFVYDCRVKDADGNCIEAFGKLSSAQGHGVTIDRKGRTWSVAYGAGIRIHNPDGSVYTMPTSEGMAVTTNSTGSHISSLTLNGTTHAVTNVRGIGLAPDGNILVVVRDRVLYKINVETGQPMASWVGPTTLNGSGTISFTNPTATNDGKVYVGSVVTNHHFIVKQNAANSTTFDVLANGFELPERTGLGVVRASAISPEGNTIYIPATSGNRLFKYTSANGLTDWAVEEVIDLPNPAANSIYAAGNNKVYVAVNSSGSEPAKLFFRDDTDPNQKLSWSLPLPEIVGADLRGLAVSKGFDTLYTTAANTTMYRYVVPSGGGSPEPPKDLLDYTIAQARPVNSNGVATQAGKYVRLKGVVNSGNLSRAAYDFSLVDGDKAIQVYKLAKGAMTYVPQMGDSIAAIGLLRQYNGLLRLEIDSVRLIQQSRSRASRTLVSSLTEDMESFPVTLMVESFPNRDKWTPGVGYHGFEVQVIANGGQAITVFVPSTSEFYNRHFPDGSNIVMEGVVQQFKAEAPYTSGYFLSLSNVITLTGIRKDNAAEGVKLYPVPTDGKLYLKMPESIRKQAQVQVVDLAGKTLLVKSGFGASDFLDLTNLSSGTYLVIIHTAEGKIIRRVVKN